MTNCENCDRLSRELLEISAILDRVRAVLDQTTKPAAGRAPKEYITDHGRLIAATASAKGLKLSDVSASVGYARDYLARVCRGDLALSRRTALLFGSALGVDLLQYVVVEQPPRTDPPQNSQLPLPSHQAVETEQAVA